jgi:hypothetical protein
MFRRIACIGLCVALACPMFGLIISACYTAPKPECGFVCGPSGECPADYACASDRRCHLNGTPASLVCAIDAGVDARPVDARPDAPFDAHGDAGLDADTSAPTVTARMPTNNQTNVAQNTLVTATFSEAVMGVSMTTFTLMDGSTPVPGSVSYASGTHIATFSPTSLLATNTTYSAALTSGITDTTGNALSPVTWTFTTVPDTTPPTVMSTAPANNDTNVAVGSTIVVVFDEPVANVDTTSFAVTDAGTPIAGTITASGGGTTYTFTPTATLPAATVITVTLSTAITDLAANPLATVTFTFTTA